MNTLVSRSAQLRWIALVLAMLKVVALHGQQLDLSHLNQPLAGANLDFGSLATNATAQQKVLWFRGSANQPGTLALSSLGLASADVGGLRGFRVTGPTLPQGGLSMNMSAPIPSSYVARLEFDPTGLSPGSYSATLSFNLIGSTSGNATQTLNLTAVVTAAIPTPPDIRLSAGGAELRSPMAQLDLGAVAIGQSTNLSLQINNLGDAALENLQVSIIGADAAQFSCSAPPATLAAGAQHSLTLSLSPTGQLAGLRRAILQISSNDPDEAVTTLRLSGRASTEGDSLGVEQIALRAWGLDAADQTQIPALPPGVAPSQVAAAKTYAVVLGEGGEIRESANANAAFGRTPLPSPTANDPIVLITCGGNHSLALTQTGKVKAWGNNDNTQCDVPADLPTAVAIAAGADFSLALLADGNIRMWGGNDAPEGKLYQLDQVPALPAGMRYLAIAAGDYHALALRSDGSVVGWGLDYDTALLQTYLGQASPPTLAQSAVVAIAAGAQHSLAIRADGSLVAWGDNSAGQCNIPNAAGTRRAIAIAAGSKHSVASFDDGSLLIWGDNGEGQANLPPLLQNALSLAAGDGFTAVITRQTIAANSSLQPALNAIRLKDGSGLVASSAVYELRNEGASALSGIDLVKSGSQATSFSVEFPGSATSLPPSLSQGATTRFTVHCLPPSATNTTTQRALITLTRAGQPQTTLRLQASAYGVDVPQQAAKAILSLESIEGTLLPSDSRTNLDDLLNYGLPQGKLMILRNLGNAPLLSLASSLNGENATDFTFAAPFPASALPSVLAPGQSALLLVLLQPASNSPGPRTTQLQVTSKASAADPLSTLNLNLDGTAGSEITVLLGQDPLESSAVERDFGNLVIATASSLQRSFTLRNDGNLDLSNLTLTLSGEHAADYQISPLASTTLAPGAAQNFSLTFAPSVLGGQPIRRANLTLTSNDADESSFTINLRSSVVNPALVVRRAGLQLSAGDLLDFGDVNLGASSSAIALTLSNEGTTDVTDLSFTKGGARAVDFLLETPASNRLAPGQSATLSLSFRANAGAQGLRQASLAIASNDPRANPLNLGMKGRAIAPMLVIKQGVGEQATTLASGSSLTLDPATIGNPAGSSLQLILSSEGLSDLSAISASITGAAAADFSISTLPSTLAAGAETNLNLSFHPLPGAIGLRRATLVITSNAVNSPQYSFPLAALAQSPALAVTEGSTLLADDNSTLSFGTYRPGPDLENPLPALQKTILLSNVGNLPLESLSLSIVGANAANFTASQLSATTLAPSAQLSLTLSFMPSDFTQGGDQAATLQISSNDPNSPPYTIALRANQLASVFSLVLQDHRGVDFETNGAALSLGLYAPGRLGTPGSTRTLTLRNEGDTSIPGLRVNLEGLNVADYRVTTFFPPIPASGLAPGAQTQIALEFIPSASALATKRAKLVLTTSLAQAKRFEFELEGESVALRDKLLFLGDGLTDNGNLSPLDRPGFSGGRGRLSNGPIWADFLAPESRIATAQDGNNFAQAGARLQPGSNGPSFADQVDDLLQSGIALSDKTLLVWMGFHDLQDMAQDRELLNDSLASAAAIDSRLAVLEQQLQRLSASAGLFVLNQLPALSHPAVLAMPLSQRELVLALQRSWNSKLAQMLARLGGNRRLIDAEAMLINALARPTAFGLASASTPLFCDNWHPNSLLHSIIGRQITIASFGNPEIAPTAGTLALVSGKSTLTFARPKDVPNPDQVAWPLELRISNSGTSALNGLSAVIEGDPTIALPSANALRGLPRALAAGQNTTLQLKFHPNDPQIPQTASAGGAKQATLKIYSTDRDEPVFAVTLRASHAPAPQILSEGQALSLGPIDNSSLTSTPLSLAWKLNGRGLLGEIQPGFFRRSASMTDGGAYTADVREASGVVTVVGPSEVVVVEGNSANPRPLLVRSNQTTATSLMAQLGASATALPTLSYQWMRTPSTGEIDPANLQGVAITNGGPVSGATSRMLSLNPALAGGDVGSLVGTYYCRVTFGESSVNGSFHQIRSITAPPSIRNLGSTQSPHYTGTVGQWLRVPILLDEDSAQGAESFTAAGLPPGLTLNPQTGVISGFPTTARIDPKNPAVDLPYEVTFTARNSLGSARNPDTNLTNAKLFLLINRLPTQLGYSVPGTYVGFLPRSASINGNLGGRVDVTVTATGQISGKVALGRATARSFTGGFATADNQSWSGRQITLPASTAGPALNIGISLNATGASFSLTLPSLVGEDQVVATNLWRARGRITDLNVATRYQMLLTPPEALDGSLAPKGTGFMTLTVSTAGIYSLTGRTPDGETITQSASLGNAGEFGLHQILYATTEKGSILSNGDLRIQWASGDLNPVSNHHLIAGSVSLQRPANPALPTTARLYRSGFAATTYQVVGGHYPAMPAAASVLGNIPLNGAASITFPVAELASATSLAGYGARIGAGSRVLALTREINSVPTDISTSNPNLARLTLVPVHGSGAVSGSFTLTDTVGSVRITRTVTYQGLAVRHRPQGASADAWRAEGYLLVDELPLPGQPANATPRLSLPWSLQWR